MNFVDLILLAIIGAFVLIGWYRGFLASAIQLVAYVISFGVSAGGYRLLASSLNKRFDLLETFVKLSEGTEFIGDVEIARSSVTSVSSETISRILDGANLPQFAKRLIESNIKDEAFKELGLSTVADYFNYSMMAGVLNVLCFVGLFILALIVFSVLLSMVTSVVHLPVLRQFDSLLGAGLGLIFGILVLQVVYMLAPAVLTMLPVGIFEEWLTGGVLSGWMAKDGFLLRMIRGVI
ncbi:MAG: CvpA family protein [Christensenellales bacterium]|jgi:uncharacterized membrane protein required for colicin V production